MGEKGCPHLSKKDKRETTRGVDELCREHDSNCLVSRTILDNPSQ